MLRKVAPRPYKTMVRRFTATEATAEGAPASHGNKAILQLVRFDPEKNATRVESYEYDKHHDYMVLDLLIAIKAHQDPTLAFRSSCCEGVCGSCAMNINGINSLSCITFAQQHTTVGPLPNFPVIKDFVVDLRHFFQQYAFIRPFVRNANLVRSQVDGIVERYENIARVVNGMSPSESKYVMQMATKSPQVETEVTVLLRLADALTESGNVTRLVMTLEKLEGLGIALDHAKTVGLIETALRNQAAKVNAAA